MPEIPDTDVVGTYTSREQAERAREYLLEEGIGPVEYEAPSEAAWQVKVPRERHDDARDVLQRREQGIIADFQ